LNINSARNIYSKKLNKFKNQVTSNPAIEKIKENIPSLKGHNKTLLNKTSHL